MSSKCLAYLTMGILIIVSYYRVLGSYQKRILIISTWRSGSSFLGEIFESLPGTFYYYEPLHSLGTRKLRDHDDLSMVYMLNDLLHCKMDQAGPYIKELRKTKFLLELNHRLNEKCPGGHCLTPRFLSKLCLSFQNIVAKVVRLNLNSADILLSMDEKLQVIFLIRDPRGIMHSRNHPDIIRFCKPHSDCGSSRFLCNEMEKEFHESQILSKKYPGRFHLVKFEEFITSDIQMNVKKIFLGIGLPFHGEVGKFIADHTSYKVSDDDRNTYRNSIDVPFAWRMKMSQSEQKRVNRICRKALRLWNYPLS